MLSGRGRRPGALQAASTVSVANWGCHHLPYLRPMAPGSEAASLRGSSRASLRGGLGRTESRIVSATRPARKVRGTIVAVKQVAHPACAPREHPTQPGTWATGSRSSDAAPQLAVHAQSAVAHPPPRAPWSATLACCWSLHPPTSAGIILGRPSRRGSRARRARSCLDHLSVSRRHVTAPIVEGPTPSRTSGRATGRGPTDTASEGAAPARCSHATPGRTAKLCVE